MVSEEGAGRDGVGEEEGSGALGGGAEEAGDVVIGEVGAGECGIAGVAACCENEGAGEVVAGGVVEAVEGEEPSGAVEGEGEGRCLGSVGEWGEVVEGEAPEFGRGFGGVGEGRGFLGGEILW